MTGSYLGCDLGAESGRLMYGVLRDGHIHLEEVHRFMNTPVRVGDSLCWDISGLFDQLRLGLRSAAQKYSGIKSISCDSWGVDYLLFDVEGRLIPPFYHYRDDRCPRGVDAIHGFLTREDLYALTGIQYMVFNSIYQMGAETEDRLARARCFLPIADGFNYLLSGRSVVEQSSASTTALYDPQSHSWCGGLLEKLPFDSGLFPEIVPSGTLLGSLKQDLLQDSGLKSLAVAASCSHDTAAAVAAVPASGDRWAYISSGTWSLMGVEIPHPIMTNRCRQLNFTNEVGVGQSIRLLKNLIGLWMVQETRRDLESAGQVFDYSQLTSLASEAPAFTALIDPTDSRFLAPGGMIGKIQAFCNETDQPKPTAPGHIIRCILESLALLYRNNLLQIQELIGNDIERVHIVGGGSRNHLLNQFTADALGVTVIAGPAEGTALGNILVQAIANHDLESLDEARKVVQSSVELQAFTPDNTDAWKEPTRRFNAFFEDGLA